MAEGQKVWDKANGKEESWKTGSTEMEERQEAYIEWLLTPPTERIPPTKAEFADVVGVTTQTLRNYARDPKVQKALRDRGRAINKVERASDVLDALFKRATGSVEGLETPASAVTAAKVWLDWVDRRTDDDSTVDLDNMTREEMLALLEKAYDVVDDS